MNNQRPPFALPRIVNAMLLGGCLIPIVTFGAVYESKMRGFSVAYPDGWTVLSQEELKETGEAISELKEKAGGRPNDPRAVVITEPNVEPAEMAAHINVTITRTGREFVISEKTLPDVVKLLDDSWSKMGMQYEKLEQGLRKIGSNQGLYMEWRGADPVSGVEKRFWQHMTSGREQVYTISCAAPETEAEAFRETCRSALESFKKDIGIEGFLSSIPESWRSMFQGVFIGLLTVLVVQWWNKRKKAKAEPDPSILE